MKKFNKIFKKKLENILLDSGLINEEIAAHGQKEMERTGRLLGDVLVEDGYCQEGDIARELARNLQLPFLDLKQYNLTQKLIEEVPAQLLHKYQVLPVDRFGSTMTLAMSQHLNLDAYTELKEAIEGEITFFVARMSHIRDALEKMVPFDRDQLKDIRKKKEEKPKMASWTDIFDTANKNVQTGNTIFRPKPADKTKTTGLDLFDTLNRKVIDGLQADEGGDDDDGE